MHPLLELVSSCSILATLLYTFSTSAKYDDELRVASIIKNLNHIVRHSFYNNSNIQGKVEDEFNSMRLVQDMEYCVESDAYKFYHPSIILEDTYTIRDISDLVRKIIDQKTFQVAVPRRLQFRKNDQLLSNFRLPRELTLYYTYDEPQDNEFNVGLSTLCLFQKQNHMVGKHAISSKNVLMNNYFKYMQRHRQKKVAKECIKNASFIPHSYRLYVEEECQEFFNYTFSEEYQEKFNKSGPQFLTKLGNEVHRGKGIVVLFKEEMEKLQKEYENGTLCKDKKEAIFAQKYISNPYLYKKHKIEFRIYFFIASTNPLIIYSYQRALIKRCAKEYDLFSTEKAAHVCNTAIVKKSMEAEKEYSDEEIENEEFFIDWNLEGLQEKLLQDGRIRDPRWLENYLYPYIYRSIIHAVRSGLHLFRRDSKFSEFFACDFLLSDDLELFILEINYNPQVLAVTPDRVKRNYKMIMDTVEILDQYLKSRYVRLRKFIKVVLNKMKKTRKTAKIILHESKLRDEFLEIYKDKLEPQYQISPDNLYVKITDGNDEKKYGDYVHDNCRVL